MFDAIALDDRGAIALSGEDAISFLHNLVTNDIRSLAANEARFAALLTPQGKIVSDFLVFLDRGAKGDRLLLDCPRAPIEDLIARLNRYRLRAKMEVENLSNSVISLAYFVDDKPQDESIVVARDPRSPQLGWRALAPKGAIDARGPRSDYEARRIALAVPDGRLDFTYGDAYPHEANMDRLNGLDFEKGCYVGQEVVARMQHRTQTRKRVTLYRSAEDAPPAGSTVSIGGADIGATGSHVARSGLALIRLDRLREAVARGEKAHAAGVALEFADPTDGA